MAMRIGRGGLLLALLGGCGDNGGGTGTSQGSEGTGTTVSGTGTSSATLTSTSGDPTTEPTGGSQGGTMTATTGTDTGTSAPVTITETSTTVDPSGTVGTTGTSGSSGGSSSGGELCQGTLCGQPVVCCAPDEECVEQKCLPACPSEVRCGDNLEVCCPDGAVCSAGQCVVPGDPCADSYDCDPGEYCEPTLDKCLPQADPLLCEVVPNFGALTVTQEWAFAGEDVISSPAIGDVTGDGVPEVIVNTTNYQSNNYINGIVLALDGTTGAELWRITPDIPNKKYGSHGRTTLGIGDVSGDGVADIVYAGRQDANGRSPIHAVDGTGAWLWTSRNAMNQVAVQAIQNGGVTLANFDEDDPAEIVWGASLFDNDGLLVWSTGLDGGLVGSPADYPGGIAAAVDLTGDGRPEIVTGRQAWSVTWTPGNPPQVMVQQMWINNDGGDGWPAVADLDLNGTPEIILVASGQLRVLDGKTGKLWCGVDPTGVACEQNNALRTKAYAVPAGGRGGPPTIADFDGDGRPEAGVAGAAAYTVFDFNRAGEQIVKPANDPMPAAGAIFRRWSKTTQDQSSNCTGSSVFDFQGDGAAEVVYADECYVRVYAGTDGTEQLKLENSSATIHEYPLVADVDDDGNSEILVVANNTANNCAAIPNYKTKRGVYLLGDAGDGWVPTRRVWTQHTYHVTNALSDANIPAKETDNWTVPTLNNYRQNDQGAGVFNAPDLTIDLSVGLEMCADQLLLIATVYNKGALGVPAGVEVDFYEGLDANGLLLGTQATTKALLPGGSTKVTLLVPAPPNDMTKDYYAEVDNASQGDGAILECDEDNNDASATMAGCVIPK